MLKLPPPLTPFAGSAPLHDRARAWFEGVLFRRVAQRFTPVATSAAYTARPWDLVRADPSSAPFDVTLPADAVDGDQVQYLNTTTSANAVNLVAATGHTVKGAASLAVTGSRACALATFGATDWAVLQ